MDTKRLRKDSLIEYFINVGVGALELVEQDPERSQPITDITCVRKPENVPPGYVCLTTTMYGHSAELCGGMFSAPLYLCFTREDTSKDPITDIQIIFPDHGENCPEGYEQLPNNLNDHGNQVYLCISRSKETTMIIDMELWAPKHEHRPSKFHIIEKNINNGGSSKHTLLLCYKKSPTGFERPFKPFIIYRYPKEDGAIPLPSGTHMFCQPEGAFLSSQPSLPQVCTFVLSAVHGTPVYGCAVTFYEFLDNALLPRAHRLLFSQEKTHEKVHQKLPHQPKNYPELKYLTELYRLSISRSHLPLESYLGNLFETPVTHNCSISVKLNIGSQQILFQQPPPEHLPLCDFDFTLLFKCFSLDNILSLFSAILTERKVIICSKRFSVLTTLSETILSLIFPFVWCSPYIPVLPSTLYHSLGFPGAKLFGLHVNNVDRKLIAEQNVIIFDADNSCIRRSATSRQIEPLPVDLQKQLEFDLINLAHLNTDISFDLDRKTTELDSSDLAFPNSVIPDEIGDEDEMASIIPEFDVRVCRAAFVKFFVELMSDYEQYLLFPQNTETADIFDTKSFINNHSRKHRSFLRVFTDTTMFSLFIQQRTYPSDREEALRFFDECSQYEQKVGQTDRNHKSRENNPVGAPTILDFIIDRDIVERDIYQVPDAQLPPGCTDPPNTFYTYSIFPRLQRSKVPPPRPVSIENMKNVPVARQGTIVGNFQRALTQPEMNVQICSDQCNNKHKVKNKKTTQELRHQNPIRWAKRLLTAVFGVWFQFQVSCMETRLLPPQSITDTFNLLKRMLHDHSLIPDERIYCAVLVVCGRNRKASYAKEIFENMKAFGTQPSSFCYGAYVSAVAEGTRRGDEGPSIFQSLPSGRRYSRDKSGSLSLDLQSFLTTSPFVTNTNSTTKKNKHKSKLTSLDETNKEIDPRLLSPDTSMITPKRSSSVRGKSVCMDYKRHRELIDWKHVSLSAINICTGCNYSCTEAEVMAGWSEDDDCFFSQCPKCSLEFSPLLQIKFSSVSTTMSLASYDAAMKVLDGITSNAPLISKSKNTEISCEFLSPIVLRRELETVCLCQRQDLAGDPSQFQHEHRTLFWNMYWHFSSLDLPLGCLIGHNILSESESETEK